MIGSRFSRVAIGPMAVAMAFVATGGTSADAKPLPGTTRVESTFKGMTAFFTDCPIPPRPGSCIGYSVNARTLAEEIGRNEYKDQLVWVDASAVTIDATGIHISPDPLMTSRTDNNPPRFGGVPASVRIDGASIGRVRATVTLRGGDGSAHVAKLDVRVVGGVGAPFEFTASGSVLCPAGSATGHGSGVFSDPGTTAGTMMVDGVALSPVPTTPGLQSAQLNTSRFEGTCDPAPAAAASVLTRAMAARPTV